MWRHTIKEKWAKGTKDSDGCLRQLHNIELADSWEELEDPEKFMKINRFAYDAFMNMNLPKKFRARVEDIKGKLMNPTEEGVPPTFLNARQILWMILKEFKKPGGLLGEQGLRQLLNVKFIMSDGLADFQRQWDDCLANWPEKPTIKDAGKFDFAGLYQAQVSLDKGFNNHYTAYKTSIDASLINPDYYKLHDIVDRWLETQENTRRHEAAERAIQSKTALANGGGKGHAFNATPVAGKWQAGDCSTYHRTGKFHLQGKGCPWYHNDATKLPAHLRKGKGKGKGDGKKGKGKGKGKDGKKGKGKGKEGKKGKGKGDRKGKGKGKEERGRSTERNANGQPLRGRSPSGEYNMTMCKFVKAGKCHNPDKCHHWHPGECKGWGKGKCVLGDDCVFMHSGRSGTAMPAQAPSASKAQKAADKAAKEALKAQQKSDAAAKVAQDAKKQDP